MTFDELGLHSSLLPLLKKNNFSSPTPIQEKGIPAILSQNDVLGIAKTGSGKTASFVLPILTLLQRLPKKEKSREIDVLVLVPTRELAVQVADVFNEYGKALPNPIKTMSVYGGVSINPQMKTMFGTNILVATPGRLLDLVSHNAIELSKVRALVLDEADKMLNLGFQDEMNEIFELLPEIRQNLLFSATLSKDLESIKNILLDDPKVIKIASEDDDIESINLTGYFVTEDRKGPLLRYLIKQNEMDQVLVFTSSAQKADRVAAKLTKNGIDAFPIHGKKSQGARQSALEAFKTGKIKVLVATDLLSRGIDIVGLPFVINYELPRSPKDFIHRVGRTGRAGENGLAISFVDREEVKHFKVILKKMDRYIDMIDSDGFELHGF
ncbi:MAG: ATP-dependent RNA helicase RhlE [Saprospiraceae bacterium]|jgi:ATP-dependent RNA helicase RhlE|tara:strand:+ start:531 stop:1676 length:1146 start_codon:yes stop_codon:yes gene_type:complete